MTTISACMISMIVSRAVGGFILLILILLNVLTFEVFAAGTKQQGAYSGQDKREIKSLSANDIVALREGQGWGLAKSAEINAYLGPLHVLQFSDKLALTSDQRARIQGIFDKMKRLAQETGEKYLLAERAIDQAFADGKATTKLIEKLTGQAAQLRARLRAIHLNAHLETTPLLTRHQRVIYARVRGYNAHARGSHHGHHHTNTEN